MKKKSCSKYKNRFLILPRDSSEYVWTGDLLSNGLILIPLGENRFFIFFLRFSFVLFFFYMSFASRTVLSQERLTGASSQLQLGSRTPWIVFAHVIPFPVLVTAFSPFAPLCSAPGALFACVLSLRPAETVEEEKWCLLREGAAIEGSQTMTQRFLLLVACNVLSDAIEVTRLSRDISISIIIPELAECNSQWGTCFCVLALYTNNRTNRRVFFFLKKNCFSLHLSFKRLLTVFF